MSRSLRYAAPPLVPLDGDDRATAASASALAQTDQSAPRPSPILPAQMALLAFLLSLLCYFALTPWVLKHWLMTGDEPHYLLIAQSLLADGDIDLANNYLQQDYADFYFSTPWLDPHVLDSAEGTWRPFHEVSFSLLILPAWALGRYAGVLFFLNLVAALVAANVWLLAHETSGSSKAAWLSWLAVTFSVPLFPYAFQIYPEMPAALLIIWTARQIIRPERLVTWRWAAVGLILVALPWLVIRFLPAALLFAALFCVAGWQRRESDKWRWLAWLGGGLVGLTLIAALNWRLYGQLSPLGASVAGRVSNPLAQWFSPANHLDSVLGWLFDQRMGLLVYAPIYAPVFLGLGLLWRRNRWAAVVLGGALAAQYLSLGFVKFQVRWGIPPRYLVAVLPLAGGALAACWRASRARTLRAIVVALLAVSLLTAAMVMAEPLRAFADEYAESGVVRFYSEYLRMNFGRFLPMFMPSTRYKDKGWDDKPEAPPRAHLFPQFKALSSPAGALAREQEAAAGWATRAAASAGILLAGPKTSLPAGAYELRYRLKLGQAPADERAVGMITVRAKEEIMAQRELHVRDLGANVYQEIVLTVVLPERREIYGELAVPEGSALWADEIVLRPLAIWPARIKGALWGLTLLACSICGYWLWDVSARASGADVNSESYSRVAVVYRAALALAAVLAVAMFSRFWYSYGWVREYEAEWWATQTGRAVDDPAASGGRAMAGKVGLDQPGWLSYGPYEVLAAGNYELSFWVKRENLATKGVAPSTAIAFGEATNVAAHPIFGRREVRLEDIPRAGEYVKLTLRFANPKWQKLVFRVYFLGVADLQFDRVRFVRLLR